MEQSKVNFIWSETNDLHDKTTELYEALMEKETDEAVALIDSMRSKLLTIRKDIVK